MQKIYYVAMIGCVLAITDVHAMIVKNYRRIRPPYSTMRKFNTDTLVIIKDSMKDLLEQKNNNDNAIAMLKKIQVTTNNQKGDIYPLGAWNLYLSLSGMDSYGLALHSRSCRNGMLEEQEASKKRIDDAIKHLANPYGTIKKDEQLDDLLQKSAFINEEFLEEDLINSMQSAKTIHDTCTNAILYRALYPEKSILKAYMSKDKKNGALKNKLADLHKEIEMLAIVETRS